jgi:UPF0176 protein
VHTNCRYRGCNLLFLQCPECAAYFDGYCSRACREEDRISQQTGVYRPVRSFSQRQFRKGRLDERLEKRPLDAASEKP